MAQLKPVIPEPEDTVAVRRSSLIPLVFLIIGFASGLAMGYFTWGANAPQAAALAPAAAAQKPAAVEARVDVPVGSAPIWGPADAPVTIIEFSDYECPFCRKFHAETWPQLQQAYANKIRLVYKDFPLGGHPNASPAALAARCANDQSKYWQFHDKLFSGKAFSNAYFEQVASELGLNLADWKSCFSAQKYAKEIQADYSYGEQLGIDGTPTFFINGVRLIGAQPYSAFKKVIDQELAAKN